MNPDECRLEPQAFVILKSSNPTTTRLVFVVFSGVETLRQAYELGSITIVFRTDSTDWEAAFGCRTTTICC